MTTTSTTELRCPRCAAAVPHAAHWCSLCFADLRPAPAPAAAPGPDPAAVAGAGPADPGPAVLAEPPPGAPPAGRARGRHARRPDATATAPRADGLPPETAAEVETLLAELRGASAAGMGQLTGLVGSPARKAAVMLGGGLAAMLVLVLVMAVAGALL